MSRSAPLPTLRGNYAAAIQTSDARARLYLTEAETAHIMRHGAGFSLCFGPGGVWLDGNAPDFRAAFDFVLAMRTREALQDEIGNGLSKEGR